jgi:ribosomal protein L37AE/L43A
LEFSEGANVSQCPFCNLPFFFQSPFNILSYYLESKLSQREIPFLLDRYRKEKKESLSQRVDEIKLCYLPFWRFTSEVFYTLIDDSGEKQLEEEKETGILTKAWDISFLAHYANDLGLTTLGMRPEWLQLRLLTDRCALNKGEVLNLELTHLSAKDKALKSLQLLMESKISFEKRLILKLLDEILSLIYFPLWIANFIAGEGRYHQIIDGITGRTLKQSPGYFELKKNESREAQEVYPPKIIPHRCPNCGWDLPVNPSHSIFPCENCNKIWKISENGYLPIKGETAKIKNLQMTIPSRPVTYYPLWVFETRPKREENFSIQKLVKLFPSEIGWFKVKDKSKPFLFYVPAFEIRNLDKFIALSLALTRTQPDLKTETWEKTNLAGAVRSAEDAQKIAEILWLHLICKKKNLPLDEWKDLVFENEKIVWYPYYEEGNFLEDVASGYTFQTYKSPV